MEKTEKNIKIHTSPSGGKYYTSLPPDTRQATMEDFYDHRGRLIVGKPYLVESIKNKSRYWASRVNRYFPYPDSDFKKFMDEGRVYVWKEN